MKYIRWEGFENFVPLKMFVKKSYFHGKDNFKLEMLIKSIMHEKIDIYPLQLI